MQFSSPLRPLSALVSRRPAGSRSSHWSKGWFALSLLALSATASSAALDNASGRPRGTWAHDIVCGDNIVWAERAR